MTLNIIYFIISVYSCYRIHQLKSFMCVCSMNVHYSMYCVCVCVCVYVRM